MCLTMLYRQQLANVIAAMSSMREKWQTDVQQVEELAAVAGRLRLCDKALESCSCQVLSLSPCTAAG